MSVKLLISYTISTARYQNQVTNVIPQNQVTINLKTRTYLYHQFRLCALCYSRYLLQTGKLLCFLYSDLGSAGQQQAIHCYGREVQLALCRTATLLPRTATLVWGLQVRASSHFQLNQPTRCSNFSSLLLVV